MTKFYLYC